MAKSSRELLSVLYEIEERIHDVHIAARGREGVRLSFVDQVELERMVVSGLSDPGDGVRDRPQLVVQRGRFDDFALGLQLVEDFLAHLQLVVLILSCGRGLAAGDYTSDQTQHRNYSQT